VLYVLINLIYLCVWFKLTVHSVAIGNPERHVRKASHKQQ